MRAVRITAFGGPEVLQMVEDQAEPVAGPGSFVLDVDHAGINYADTHQVEDSYLASSPLPLVPGGEAVGRAPDGRRVVALLSGGGCAERVAVADALAFDVPDEVDDGQALALVVQGTTAWHLLRTCAHLQEGESVVVHAAAGGVGTLAVQLAKRWGAGQVIAVASTEEKRKLAIDVGADATVDADTDDLKSAIEEANGGKVDVVLEMVGGRTTDQSLAALGAFGRLVYYGTASRLAPSAVDPQALMSRSRAVIGFWLAHAIRQPQRHLDGPMEELLALTAGGALRPVVGGIYAMSDVAVAHRDLRERRTVGKLLLDPRR